MKAMGHLIRWCITIQLVGCAGAKTEIRFEALEHPVSMSPVLRPQPSSRSPRKVGSFERVARAYGTLYGLILFDPVTDLSERLEQEIARHKGDGIVNLHIRSSGCTSNGFVPFNLIPFWPSCVHLRVTGDVVVEEESAP